MTSTLGVFRNRAFAVIVMASAVANLGAAMFDTASSWLMTSLNSDPVLVSAVQVATMLPMFLLTLPAGTLADIVDPRRLLIGSEIFVTLVALGFAVVVSLKLTTAPLLLIATFLLCAGGAIAAPAWLLTTPMLVSKEELDSAVAINNVSANVSRAVGPAIGGFAIAAFNIGVPFWFYLAANVGIVGALVWWRAPRRTMESLPAERFINAIESGVRYVRNSRDLGATVARALAFFPFASAYWALLPLIARQQSPSDAAFYGVLFGALGLGSMAGSLALNWLKERLGPDGMMALGAVGTVIALWGFAVAHAPALALASSLLAGASWIISVTTLFVSAQVALPSWVRGRGLAFFLTIYFGAMTFGSALWGKVANVEGLPTALSIAGGRRLDRGVSELAVETAYGQRPRPIAVHALARAGVRTAPRRRFRAHSDDRRISDRPQGPDAVPDGARGHRSRAEARWRLCVGLVRGCAARRPDTGDLPGALDGRTPASAGARHRGGPVD